MFFFFPSYTLRVVRNGIRAQSANPEVKVKGEDPLINQIIDKLRHINQVRPSTEEPNLFSTISSVKHMAALTSGCLFLLLIIRQQEVSDQLLIKLQRFTPYL